MPEDMEELVALIRADIERVRRGREALAAGDRGPLGNGAYMSYAGWHIGAVVQLDPSSALTKFSLTCSLNREYASDAAGAIGARLRAKAGTWLPSESSGMT